MMVIKIIGWLLLSAWIVYWIEKPDRTKPCKDCPYIDTAWFKDSSSNFDMCMYCEHGR